MIIFDSLRHGQKNLDCKTVLNFEISQIEPKYYGIPGTPNNREDAYEMKRNLTLSAFELGVVPAKMGPSNGNGNVGPSNGNVQPSNATGNDNVIVPSI